MKKVYTLILLLITSNTVAGSELPDYYSEPGIKPFRNYETEQAVEVIDPFTGALQLQHVDLVVPGNAGLDIVVRRVYRSIAGPSGVLRHDYLTGRTLLGVGWDMHFGRVFYSRDSFYDGLGRCGSGQVSSQGNPILELADGTRKVLVDSDSANYGYITKDRWIGKCINSTNGGLEVISPQGVTYFFDFRKSALGSNAWNVTRIEDRYGNYLSIEYADPQNTHHAIIEKIESTDGRVVNFSYDNKNSYIALLKEVRLGSSVKMRYQHEPVAGHADRYLLTKAERSEEGDWHYEYYESISGSDQSGLYSLRQIENPFGARTEYTYQQVHFSGPVFLASTAVNSKSVSRGETVSGSWSYSFAPGATDTTEIRSPNYCIRYYHKGSQDVASGNVWAIGTLQEKRYYNNRSCTGLVQTEAYTWDRVEVSSQNEFHRRESAVDSNTYQPVLGNLMIERDGSEYSTSYSDFDAYGNPQTKEEQGPGGASSSRDTSFTYQNFTHPNKWILGLATRERIGSVGDISSTYYSSGSLTGNLRASNRFGVETDYSYNSSGDISEVDKPGDADVSYGAYYRGTPERETHQEGVVIRRNVNSTGTVAWIEDGEGRRTNYSYDSLNRLTSIATPRSDDSNITIRWSNGGRVRTTTRGAFSAVATHDGFGRLLRIVAEGVTKRYEYNAEGHRVFESNLFRSGSGVGRTFDVDVLGRVTRVTHADGSRRDYDYLANNKVRITNELGHSTTSTYRSFGDPNERYLVKIEAPESVVTNIETDKIGNIKEVRQGGFTRRYVLDSRKYLDYEDHPETGRVQLAYSDSGALLNKRVGTSPTTRYVYDKLERIERIDYPSSTEDVRYKYDKASNLEEIENGESRWAYAYDDNDNLESEVLRVTGKTLEVSYEYDSRDNLSSITYPDGLTVDYAPDDLGRPTRVGGFANSVSYHANGQASTLRFSNGVQMSIDIDSRREFIDRINATGIVNLRYTTDAGGNVKGIIDGINSENNLALGYDNLNRLTSANGSWGAGSISYSRTGDITRKNIGGHVLNYQYSGSSNLLSRTSGSKAYDFSYDSYGNVVDNGTDAFSYNHASQLTEVDNLATEYKYDGNSRRILIEEKGKLKKVVLYDRSGKLLYETDPQSDVRANYIYLGRTLIAKQQHCDKQDNDYDGLDSCEELRRGLDHLEADSDGDQMPDGWEVEFGLDPLVDDADIDSDGDGDVNLVEFLGQSDPKDPLSTPDSNSNLDSDRDGLPNREEIDLGTDPYNPDSDFDQMEDGWEVRYGLDPLFDDAAEDLDQDGYSNLIEYRFKTDPTDPESFPPDAKILATWEFKLGGSERISSNIAEGRDGTIYFASNTKVYAVAKGGELDWSYNGIFQCGGNVSIAVGHPDNIYVACNYSHEEQSEDDPASSFSVGIIALDANGILLWSSEAYGTSLALGLNSIYLGAMGYYADPPKFAKVTALDLNGQRRWERDLIPEFVVGAGFTNFLKAPMLDGDGLVAYTKGGRSITPAVAQSDAKALSMAGILIKGIANTDGDEEPPKVLGDWQIGDNHQAPDGDNRLLVLTVHANHSELASLSNATYGGVSMHKVAEHFQGEDEAASTAVYILKETGLAAALDDSFNLSWSQTPSSIPQYTSAFIANVEQLYSSHTPITELGVTGEDIIFGEEIETSTSNDLLVLAATSRREAALDYPTYLSIGRDQRLVAVSADEIFTITSDGRVIWSADLGVDGFIPGPAVLSEDDRVYFTFQAYDGPPLLLALDIDGAFLWANDSIANGSSDGLPLSSPVLADDGTIYLFSIDLHSFTSDGEFIARSQSPTDTGRTPALSASNSIYYSGGEGVFEESSKGELVWSNTGFDRFFGELTLGARGSVYVASEDSNTVYKFQNHGRGLGCSAWPSRYQSSQLDSSIFSSLPQLDLFLGQPEIDFESGASGLLTPLEVAKSSSGVGLRPSAYLLYRNQPVDVSAPSSRNKERNVGWVTGPPVRFFMFNRHIGTNSLIEVELPTDQSITEVDLEAEVTCGGLTTRKTITLIIKEPIGGVPLIRILQPADRQVIPISQAATLSALANDDEDGDISHLIEWVSNRDGSLGVGAVLEAPLSPGDHFISARVADTDEQTSSRIVRVFVEGNEIPPLINLPPNVEVTSPGNEDLFRESEVIVLVANASDPEDGDVSNNIQWSSSLDGVLGVGAEINVSLSFGEHQITALITDNLGKSAIAVVNVSVVSDVNTTPTLNVLAPISNSVFTIADVVSLNATASDTEDGNLSANVIWESSLEGGLGTGGPLNISLGQGQHTISARVTDSGGLMVVSTISILVTDNPIEGTDDNNTLIGTNESDWLNGGLGNDELYGNSGNDLLIGGAGNDSLMGGEGADQMRGGTGNDYYQVDDTNDLVIEFSDEGYDTVQSSIDYILGEHLERIVLLEPATTAAGNDLNNEVLGNALNNQLSGMGGNDQLYGYAGADQLYGGPGNDYLDGGVGADQMVGGLGNDYYYVDDSGDTVLEQVDAGYDTVRSSINYVLNDNFERVELIGVAANATGNDFNNEVLGNQHDNQLNGLSGNDQLYGYAGTDQIDGGDGDDTLNGGEGADQMVGGLGNDYYYVDDTSDTVLEQVDAGYDTVRSSINYLLGDHFERLQLIDMALTGGGNNLNNDIQGNEHDNQLSGLAGNDELYGYVGVDQLDGGDGHDTLNGGVGADQMVGGLGNDYYYVDDSGDTVLEQVDAGYDTVRSSINYVLNDNFERVQLIGAAVNGMGNDLNNEVLGNEHDNQLNGLAGNDQLYGYAGVDLLDGGEGNDYLNGGAGADQMAGGLGDDFYRVDDPSDLVTEVIDSGYDSVQSSINYVLEDNSERLYLLEPALEGEGNQLNNEFVGNPLNNTLIGNEGNDLFYGRGGNDHIFGGEGDDSLYGEAGDDILNGALGNDRYYLAPGWGNDQINNQDPGVGTEGHADIVTFTGGITPEDVVVTRSGDDLIISSDGHSVNIVNYFLSNQNQIDQVSFSDGTYWNRTTLEAQVAE